MNTILFILMLCASLTTPDKMIVIFGKPQEESFSKISLDFMSCVDYCYELDSCMAVYSASEAEDCHIFDVGQLSKVTETDESDGQKVAFKMNTTMCYESSEDNSMIVSFKKSRPHIQNLEFQTDGPPNQICNITNANGVWKFTPCPSCPSNFTMFTRPNGKWCIGVVPTIPFVTNPQAESLCQTNYGGVLTREPQDHANAFLAETFRIDVVIPMLGSPLWSAWTTVGFWINGQRKEACKTQKSSLCNTTAGFDFTDPLLSENPTGYIWGVNQPSGGGTFDSSCLHFSFNTSTKMTQSVDDYTCGVNSSTTGSAGFVGYICGVVPS
ncbi:CRE-CLEC-112 protein [Caenorhabditis remanei]|uniref:CRE-CLEC-112 protein n=1 Tax=Caenorhabditis remanei TaxID=31234 RepID=E3N7E6_CAERE|nr:CRE-CLEC-112 protein [Caenorhabditis remanei]